MKDEIFLRIITDSNAPARLKNKEVVIILRDGQMDFNIEFPDDVTKNEIAYFKYYVGEFCDDLNNKNPEGDYNITGSNITDNFEIVPQLKIKAKNEES